MTREEALKAIKARVQNGNLVKHMLAVEAVMRALARRFGEDEEAWGLAGLLHDIDVELTRDDMQTHSRLGADMVRELSVGEAIVQAVLRHNEAHGLPPETKMDKALFCADPLTGLVTATALVHPERLGGLEARSVLKRYKAKAFAAGVNREQMAKCDQLGLSLEEFVQLGIEAMRGVRDELGL